jgi:hypothetical protein
MVELSWKFCRSLLGTLTGLDSASAAAGHEQKDRLLAVSSLLAIVSSQTEPRIDCRALMYATIVLFSRKERDLPPRV